MRGNKTRKTCSAIKKIRTGIVASWLFAEGRLLIKFIGVSLENFEDYSAGAQQLSYCNKRESYAGVYE